MRSSSLLVGVLVSVGVMLSGCDKADTAKTPAQLSQPAAAEKSAEQQEVEKYNLYVEAANRGGNFGEILQQRREEYQPALASKKPLTNYYIFNTQDITNVRENFTKALAINVSMPELDEPAKTTLVALEKLAPLQADLANYAASKGYLSDDGKKARDSEPALDAALEAVAVEQEKFFDGLTKRDEINTRKAFDDADKDSVEYYEAGIVLYAKESVKNATAFYRANGESDTAKPFEDSLNKTAQMIEGWDKKTRSADKPSQCSSTLSTFNSFVAKGRESIANARKGDYKPRDEGRMMKMDTPAETDAKRFGSLFNDVINKLNTNKHYNSCS